MFWFFMSDFPHFLSLKRVDCLYDLTPEIAQLFIGQSVETLSLYFQVMRIFLPQYRLRKLSNAFVPN